MEVRRNAFLLRSLRDVKSTAEAPTVPPKLEYKDCWSESSCGSVSDEENASKSALEDRGAMEIRSRLAGNYEPNKLCVDFEKLGIDSLRKSVKLYPAASINVGHPSRARSMSVPCINPKSSKTSSLSSCDRTGKSKKHGSTTTQDRSRRPSKSPVRSGGSNRKSKRQQRRQQSSVTAMNPPRDAKRGADRDRPSSSLARLQSPSRPCGQQTMMLPQQMDDGHSLKQRMKHTLNVHKAILVQAAVVSGISHGHRSLGLMTVQRANQLVEAIKMELDNHLPASERIAELVEMHNFLVTATSSLPKNGSSSSSGGIYRNKIDKRSRVAAASQKPQNLPTKTSFTPSIVRLPTPPEPDSVATALRKSRYVPTGAVLKIGSQEDARRSSQSPMALLRE